MDATIPASCTARPRRFRTGIPSSLARKHHSRSSKEAIVKSESNSRFTWGSEMLKLQVVPYTTSPLGSRRPLSVPVMSWNSPAAVAATASCKLGCTERSETPLIQVSVAAAAAYSARDALCPSCTACLMSACSPCAKQYHGSCKFQEKQLSMGRRTMLLSVSAAVTCQRGWLVRGGVAIHNARLFSLGIDHALDPVVCRQAVRVCAAQQVQPKRACNFEPHISGLAWATIGGQGLHQHLHVHRRRRCRKHQYRTARIRYMTSIM